MHLAQFIFTILILVAVAFALEKHYYCDLKATDDEFSARSPGCKMRTRDVWSYNKTAEVCEAWEYTGCQAIDGNRFSTFGECAWFCNANE
ncbi:carboxypeptidase inhibitor SmCI-like [Drosophila willistoni]|uniref:carboxypeptidase inhibitor SmCI-like n=1 Tax=Drosophila willistoni TaxID=7260 RepID=UPI001F0733C8|nr:carboxypeptidase inhibitor SmCI-like [Drosophila willistoni]